jgi:hypothetical protein
MIFLPEAVETFNVEGSMKAETGPRYSQNPSWIKMSQPY